PAELGEVVRARGHTRTEHDAGTHPLAPLEIRYADHGGLLDRGMRLQDRLDLRRRDVLAAADDHVVLAAGDVEVAVGVEPAHVPRRKPAVAHEGGFADAGVALHHTRRANADLADLTRCEGAAVVADDLHLHVGQRPADRRQALQALLDLRGRALEAMILRA